MCWAASSAGLPTLPKFLCLILSLSVHCFLQGDFVVALLDVSPCIQEADLHRSTPCVALCPLALCLYTHPLNFCVGVCCLTQGDFVVALLDVLGSELRRPSHIA
jgi:hypothetical protein